MRECRCETCGGTNRLLHGYVYEDERPQGVYCLEWCDGRRGKRAAFLTIGLGAFGEGTGRTDRSAFCIEWRADGMRLTDERAQDRPDRFGEFVPRDVALATTNVDHLWHVADHIVLGDPRLAAVQLRLGGGTDDRES